MPGLFGTYNPTPWASSYQPAATPNYGGVSFGGFTDTTPAPPPTTPTTTAPPAVPGGTGAPAQPAPAPTAPAAPAAEVPGGTGGPGPAGPPDNFTDGGTGFGTPPIGIPSLAELLQMLQSGGGGAFQGSDVFGLPGRSKAGEQVAQLIAQFLANRAFMQGPRSSEAEGLVRGLTASGATSPAYLGSTEALNAARGRLGDLGGLRDALTQTAYAQAAASKQDQINRMRDLGLLTQGPSSTGVVGGIENRASSGLGQSLRDIELAMSAEAANRIGQLGDLSASGANAYQQLVAQPQTELANLLRQPANPAEAQLIDYLNQLAQTAVGGDVSFRAQPSVFERIGLPLINPIGGNFAGAVGGKLASSWLGGGGGAAAGGAAAAASDRRFKEDISDTGLSLGGVPVKLYRFKGSPQYHIGVIAQDAERVAPEAVYEDRAGFKYVDYRALAGR